MECPLTQLLERMLEIHEADGDDEELSGRPRRRSWEQDSKDDKEEECSQSADFAEEQSREVAASSFRKGEQQEHHAEQAAPHEDPSQKYINQEETKINDTKLEDTEQEDNNENSLRDPRADVCPHCRQELCRTCEPGYMSIIVEMKELSKTVCSRYKTLHLVQAWSGSWERIGCLSAM
jgi:hypothetical protein